jgi:hypothetical protein
MDNAPLRLPVRGFWHSPFVFLCFGGSRMPVRYWPAVLLTLVVVSGVVGCGGNYKFNDNTYRPLGDPHAANRGQ